MNRIVLLLIVVLGQSVMADVDHNIKGAFGDRAAGMSGAYTAVSDDASGAYYNPAGLGFMYDSSSTTSTFSASDTRSSYYNLQGPGQGLTAHSSGMLPSYIGVAKSIDKWRYAFSLVNPSVENYDQSIQSYTPASISTVSSVQFQFTQNSQITYTGPSIAYLLTDKLSIGLTIYAFQDKNRASQKSVFGLKGGAYINESLEHTRDTRGVIPIFGLQYMITEKVGLGFSARKPFATYKYQRDQYIQTSSFTQSASDINLYDSSTRYDNAILGQPQAMNLPSNTPLKLFGKPVTNGGIPEPVELRMGISYFLSKRFLVAADWIHTSDFSKSKKIYAYEPSASLVILTDREYRDLRVYATDNYALGLEFFLTDFIALRAGYHTNQSNSRNVSWLESAIAANLRTNGKDLINLSNSNSSIVIYPNGQQSTRIPNYVNLIGYSVGISYETSNTSLSLNYVIESGRGSALPINFTPIVPYEFVDRKVYLGASVKK